MSDRRANFVQHLCDIPVASSVITLVESAYVRTKQRNRVTRFACQTCEIGLKAVAATVKPILGRFERHIERFNVIACQQLEHLTTACPVINHPTQQILASVRTQWCRLPLIRSSVSTQLSSSSSSSDVDLASSGEEEEEEEEEEPKDVRIESVLSFDDEFSTERVSDLNSLQSSFSDTGSFLFSVLEQFNIWSNKSITQLFCTTGKTPDMSNTWLAPLDGVGCGMFPSFHEVAYDTGSCRSERKELDARSHCFSCFVVSSVNQRLVAGLDRSSTTLRQQSQKLLQTLSTMPSRLTDKSLLLLMFIFDWFTVRPPLVWILPNMTDGWECFGDDDDDGTAVTVRYVPIHPVDLANFLPTPAGPRRIYFRRRHN